MSQAPGLSGTPEAGPPSSARAPPATAARGDPAGQSRSAPRLRLRGRLRDLLPERNVLFDGLAWAEILELKDLANLDLALLEGDTLGPGEGFVPRLRLDQPEAGDELLRLGEGTVDDGALRSREPDARALRARLEPLRREQYPGLDQP